METQNLIQNEDFYIVFESLTTPPSTSVPVAVPSIRVNEVIENELILDNIIRQTIEDSNSTAAAAANKCRLVCTKWKRVATKRLQEKYWKNRTFIKLETDAKLKKYLTTIRRAAFNAQLFCCFKLERKIREKRCKYNAKTLQSFFGKENQWIKSLSLGFWPESQEQIELILKSQSKSLVELKVLLSPHQFEKGTTTTESESEKFELINLNYLCFKIPTFKSGNRSRDLISEFQMLEIILSKIPRGKEKEIKFCLQDWSGITQTIELLEKYDQINNLKFLEMSKYSTCLERRGQLNSLTTAGVKLESFSSETFSFYDESSPMLEIYEFVCSQAKNLQTLSWGSGLVFKFSVRMPFLKKLRLECSKSKNDGDPNIGQSKREWKLNFQPISYDHLFPILEELKLENKWDDWVSPKNFLKRVLPPQILPCNSLRKLTIESFGITPQILRQVSSTFPRITTLVLKDVKKCLSSNEDEREFYSILWNSDFAPVLQILYLDSTSIVGPDLVNGKYFLDSIFSGVSEKRIRKISRSFSYEDNRVTQRIANGTGSILNMISLKTLVIDFYSEESGWKRHYFRDFSAICLFAKMESLEFLHLDKNDHKFSQIALENLQGKANFRIGYPARLVFPNDADPIDQAFGIDFNSKGVDLSSLGFVPHNLLHSEN